MSFSEIIEKVGDEVVRQDLSTNAVNNLTTIQIKAMGILPPDFVLNNVKFNKILKRVALRIEIHKREKVKIAIGNELELWLSTNYPSVVFDHRLERGKSVVEIWYEGKPQPEVIKEI